MQRITLAAAGVATVLMLIMAASASAQPYPGPYVQPLGPVQPYRTLVAHVQVVTSGSAAVCGDREAFRVLLTAYANSNPYRARQLALAQNCDSVPVGARVLVMSEPTAIAIWRNDTQEDVVLQVVQVHVLNGPTRGTAGYMLLDAFQ
ncbi:MAG TPA: hypothetical protein VKZ50_10960 [bacterium]|nr:hypothetical protein [bacterium]